MVAIKGMELQTDCQKCPFMATDVLSPMMCLALWATKHCIKGKILDDCPLVEIVTCKDCKYNDENVCTIDGCGIVDDYFCSSGERRKE